jgi:hypothetical protein
LNIVENILNNYPKIIELLNLNFTLVEICKIFKEKNILDIKYNTLTSIISNIKNNKIHPEYNIITPLFTNFDNVPQFEPYSIKFNNVWICFNKSSYKKEWILTEQTIKLIPDPVAILYMKRFLKLYHISDEFLLNCYLKNYGKAISTKEYEKINNISSDIRSIYDKIVTNLKHKNLEYILGINRNEQTI